MNKIFVSGNLVADPVIIGNASKGVKILAFNIANNYGKDKVNYFNCYYNLKENEIVLKKGQKVVVSGTFYIQEKEYKGEEYKNSCIFVSSIDYFKE